MENDQLDQTARTTSCCQNLRNCFLGYAVRCAFISSFLFMALLIAIVYHGRGTENYRYLIAKPRDANISNVTQATNFSSIRKYPFVGALVSKDPDIFLCTCAILNTRYLLASANCFTVNLPHMVVRVGSRFWDRGGTEYKVDSFLTNMFNGTTMENNFALIHVSRSIFLTRNVKLAKIETGFVKANKGTVVGWNSRPAERNSTRLLEQRLEIWERKNCTEYIRNRTMSNYTCASISSNICNLGVIGVLVVNGRLVGFWSSGLSCISSPSIFNNVYHISRWLKSIIRAA